ncbi:MAG: hypothetical protein ACLP1X_27775 [Polyangiaceae bacterium]|jgi:hypothetical protein
MHRPLVIGLMGIGFVISCAGGSTTPADLGGSSGGGESSGGSNGGNSSNGSGQSSSSSSNGGESNSSSGPGSSSSNGGGNPGGSSTGGGNSSGGSGGSTSSGGSSSSSSSGSTDTGGESPTMLPTVSGTCPTIAAGSNGTSLMFAGEPVDVWTGSGTGGPLVMFWFETGGSPTDVSFQFGTTQISAVTAAGGMVASFGKSNGMGTDTGDAVWFTGDFTTADQVVACAIQQLHINTRRIFTTGASAGALQATWMSYARSGYIAAAATLSGGLTGAGGFYEDPTTMPQDPTNVPSAMAIHGATGVDVVVLDFAVASAAWEADIASKHGFSMDCNTGGGHVSGPPQICPGIWQFFEDHPFKVSPQPYPPIPTVFPSYCVIGPRAADGGTP